MTYMAQQGVITIRNPNGYGSVYKLKGRRRRPWIARVTVGWTPEGKQLYQTIGYFATKQEGLNALALYRVNPVSPRANITLGELYEEWSANKYKNISKSTRDNYIAAWKYLQPLSKAKVKDIRTTHLQTVIDKCVEKGLSNSTLEKIRVLAVMLYDYAIKNDIVNKNYAKFIELPKAEKTPKDRFTELEIKQIEKAADSVPWADTILILIYTGMRISELLGLTKFNVDLEKQLITGGVKTEAGKNRIIPIHPKILKYIRYWYEKNGETLICRDDGKRISVDYYRKKLYYPALEAIGVRRLNPHACRHTFASLLAEAGVETIYIQKIIGHTDYAFTANEYTHLEIEALRREINKM